MHSAPRPVRSGREARFRLRAVVRPQLNATQTIITALFVVLGFAGTAAIRGTAADTLLTSARQSDLVALLDDLAQREARLQAEIARLENARETLLGGDQYDALNEARRRAASLGRLAGTEPVAGSGITIDISGNLSAITLLDAIQELRDAGASAIQISDRNLELRVVAKTWFADSDNGVTVSGTALTVPVTISVIGESSVLTPALQIPGGLVDTVGSGGGSVTITPSDDVEISAVVALPD
jgi:uncharacterized protein YlxW (UPF0749 family)